MRCYDADAAGALTTTYGQIHAAVAAPARRAALVDGLPVALDDLAGRSPSIGAGLDQHLERLAALVNEFLLARRGQWPAWFYRAMLL